MYNFQGNLILNSSVGTYIVYYLCNHKLNHKQMNFAEFSFKKNMLY